MKNTLADLNNHLFEQLERLNDDEVTGDKLNEEVKRAGAMTTISKEIIANGRLALDAAKTRQELHGCDVGMPRMLEGNK
ncbi:hypothetical protein [Maridesulfovibrio sp.]|uniref:hypothetical protein n=1 Tax=Maridesulfovibrio sp. TaxID=2795000 RepID=UPI002A186F4B|nr:hypothetical protein [Maridesulfovibrio sp.]